MLGQAKGVRTVGRMQAARPRYNAARTTVFVRLQAARLSAQSMMESDFDFGSARQRHASGEFAACSDQAGLPRSSA